MIQSHPAALKVANKCCVTENLNFWDQGWQTENILKYVYPEATNEEIKYY